MIARPRGVLARLEQSRPYVPSLDFALWLTKPWLLHGGWGSSSRWLGYSGCTNMTSPEKLLTLKGAHAGRCRLSNVLSRGTKKQNSAIKFSRIKDMQNRNPMVQDKAECAVCSAEVSFLVK